MSTFFPNVNLSALAQFAAETVAADHPLRHVRGSHPQRVTPRVLRIREVMWAGEKVSKLLSALSTSV
jgi:hypothetical protein